MSLCESGEVEFVSQEYYRITPFNVSVTLRLYLFKYLILLLNSRNTLPFLELLSRLFNRVVQYRRLERDSIYKVFIRCCKKFIFFLHPFIRRGDKNEVNTRESLRKLPERELHESF